MPLNESVRPRRSNLTTQQQREAERAIYGLQENKTLPQPQTQLTRAELEQMRHILAQHDKQIGPMKEFDLNKPPVEPYRHQEFPKAMHHHGDRVTRIVASADEQKILEAQGFETKPYPSEAPPDVELDEEERAEIASIDGLLKKKKKGASS